MSDVYQVLYLSAAARLFSDVELRALLADARARNEAAGLTGMLLYEDGHFLQTLEVVVRIFIHANVTFLFQLHACDIENIE